jgi:hypothetical protein
MTTPTQSDTRRFVPFPSEHHRHQVDGGKRRCSRSMEDSDTLVVVKKALDVVSVNASTTKLKE